MGREKWPLKGGIQDKRLGTRFELSGCLHVFFYGAKGVWMVPLPASEGLSASDRLVRMVRNACSTGESKHTEFKTFVDLSEGLGSGCKKTKYRELVRTVVAFANGEGGCVFLGIDNDCHLTGIDEALRKYSQSDPSDEVLDAYRGALLSAILRDVVGEISLQISATAVNSVWVVLIEVARCEAPPMMVRGEPHYYMR